MEDAKIVELYVSRSEAAIQETDNKYHSFLHQVAYNILRDNCDSEEIVDDTYLGAWNAIPPTIPDNLKHFLSRIARNLSFDRLDYHMAGKRKAQMVELDECIPDTRQSVERIWEAKEIGAALNRFLGTLDRKSCAVFLGRYYYSYSIGELAEQYSLTGRQVRYILSKARSRLRSCLEREGGSGMTSAELIQAFQYVDDRYLDIVEQERVQGKKGHTRVYWGAVAACIGLILLLALPIAAIAAKWFGLRDLLLSPMPGGVGTERTEEGMSVNPDIQFISLAGYQDSPEVRAQAEWLAFVDSYDTSEISDEDTHAVDDRYGHYRALNQEMADRLEEIVQKYDLDLYSGFNVVSQEELAYRVGGEFMRGDSLQRTWAYIYDNGTFHCDGDVFLPNGQQADMQFGRTVKGTLDESILGIGDVEDYQEFQHITADGERVVLALSPRYSLIFADCEECFILMNILSGSDQGITRDNLAEFADALDLSVLKHVQKPEMRGDSMPEGGWPKTYPLQGKGEVENLGYGWLYFSRPAQEGEDYKICFARSENQDDEESFDDVGITLADADYLFPDVREGNAAIGSFVEHWFYWDFTTEEHRSGYFIVAKYEKDGSTYYDTRIYQARENGYGYELDEAKTQELNDSYREVEKYPVWEVLKSLDHK